MGGGGGGGGGAAPGCWRTTLPASLWRPPPRPAHPTPNLRSLSRCDAPYWVRGVMHNGFRSPAGALAIAGLHGTPLWMYARRNLPPGSWVAADGWGLLLIPGRLLAAAVEVWVLARHGRQLALEDAAGRRRRQQQKIGSVHAE